ncbi:MAG: hypothetical protein JXA07_07760 [Spirochaetes bacterium]|nr:hypothetical protein [Spirochaetota bacterium]
MKRYYTIIALIIPLFCITLYAKENDGGLIKISLLHEISSSINEYKFKTITMRLKLKNIDKIFEKITFYDVKNHDIEFDISSRHLKKKIASNIHNLHEGLEYYVTFSVDNVGNLGQIIATLKEFKPIFLQSIPESGMKD